MLKRLTFYLRGRWCATILAPLFKMIEACLELTVPLIMGRIIDDGIVQGDQSFVIRASLLLVAIGVVSLAFSVTAQYFAAKASIGVATQIRARLFAHVQALSYTELDTLGTSGLLTRLGADVNQVQTGLNLALRLLLRSPFVVFGAMIMALSVDAPSGSVFAVAIPVLCLVVFGIMLLTMPMYKGVQGHLDRITRRVRENLVGVRVIRAFGMEERERETFRRENDTLVTAQKRVGSISALLNPITYIIVNVGVVVLLWCAANRVEDGALLKGNVVELYNYFALILVELIKMASLILTITKSFASGHRIAQVMDVESSMRDGVTAVVPVEGAPKLAFSNVSLRYKNSPEDAISGVTLSVEAGEMLGVVGGTGSGKSTLASLIPRFYDATAGVVAVDGVDVKEYAQASLRDKIGIVPQKAVLFSGTVRENLQMGRPLSDAMLWNALETAVAADFVREKGGLDTSVGEGGGNFSGGQKQRLAIARALAGAPEILILDDSASALDYATAAELARNLARLTPRPTVVSISQRTDPIRHADKILVLEDGVPVGQGTHEELLTACAVYGEIHASQDNGEEVPANG